MRLGIIGAGMIVKEFLPHLTQMEGLEVVSIMARDTAKVAPVAEAAGVPHVCRSFEELQDTGIDAVYVAVPNALHFDYARRALEAGLTAIVEKPLCATAREARALSDIAHERGAFLFEAITARYLSAFDLVLSWLPKIGDVKLVLANFSQYSSRYDAFRRGVVAPVFDPAQAGGALVDLNLYNVHWVVGLFGEPSALAYFANVERGIDTSGTLVLTYPTFQATLTAAKDCAGPKLFAIEGTDGHISLDLNPGLVGQAHLRLNDGYAEDVDEPWCGARCVPEFARFVEIVETHDTAAANEALDASIRVLEVLDAARSQAGVTFPADTRTL